MFRRGVSPLNRQACILRQLTSELSLDVEQLATVTNDGTNGTGRSVDTVFAEYEAGRVTRKAFCEARGVKLSTFDYWR